MRLTEKIVGVLAPFDCLGCGSEGSLMCNDCSTLACPLVPSRCYLCRTSTTQFAVCASCKRRSSLKHVWVSTELVGLARRLLHVYKFERAQAASIQISYFMSQLPAAADSIIVSVPTASSRVRERGYDHASLLAKELARLAGRPYASSLHRLNQTRQVGTKRSERLSQLRGMLRVSRDSRIRGASILLVDDVVTTGATLEEAARVLKTAGAKTISAIVFAQR